MPQQNPLGRLLPRYQLSNLSYLVECLNQFLAQELTRYQNAYLLDLDGISATFGRRYIQDDTLWQFNHGAVLTDWDFVEDQKRLHPPGPVSDYYALRGNEYLHAIWEEIVAIFRTVRQVDTVKLVIVDLDDTLWRGVVAEEGHISVTTTEGWPLGIAEALPLSQAARDLAGDCQQKQ